MKLLAFIILIIFLFPVIVIGGIPLRVEDFLFIILVVFFPKMDYPDARKFFTILVLVVLSNMITFFIQIFLGYAPVLQDFNTLFSLLRNIVIFYGGLKLGAYIKGDFKTLILTLSIGFFISSIVSLVQFYDFAGLGIKFFLLFGKETGIEYGINRTVGTVGNPNYAAFFQICGLIGLLSLKNNLGNFGKILKIVLIPLTIWSVYVTFSRTGLLAMSLIAVAYLIFKKKYAISLVLLFLVMVSAPFFNAMIEGTRYEQLINSNSSELLTLNGRVNHIWAKKLDTFSNNPVWGIGSSKGRITNTIFSITIYDNSFIYLLVTSGLVGMLLTLWFHSSAVIAFIKSRNRETILYVLLLHVNIFIFYLTTDLVKGVMFTSYYFMSIGLLLTFREKNIINKSNESTDIDPNIKLE